MIDKRQRRASGHKSQPQASKHKGSTFPSNLVKAAAPREALTPRERAVLNQIARGANSREAGASLGVSARTIEFHRANIMRKLGARRIIDLMLMALKKNGDL
jgi:two-component system response regulator FixJ